MPGKTAVRGIADMQVSTDGICAMRDASGFDAWAARYLQENPLGPRELHAGRSVRVVSCVRADDEDIRQEPSAFVWSVLVLRCASGRDAGLRAYALGRAGLCPRSAVAVEETARATVPGPDGVWCICEYAVEIPAAYRRLLFVSGRAVCAVGGERYADETRAYFDRICNAAADVDGYGRWLERHRALLATLPVPDEDVLVSIVCPVYRTDPGQLEAMLRSVIAQTYRHWELVVVNASPDDEGVAETLRAFDDARIRVVACPENAGIAGNTNVGIAHSTGDYVCFLDHDDMVEPQALALMVDALKRAGGEVDLLYCDEDSFDERGCFRIPLFKPGRNPDLLCSNNYIIHWLMVSRRALEETVRSGTDVDGAQDYDLTFKVLELGRPAVHVPYVLYHWRIHAGSMNGNDGAKQYAQESGRKAIAGHLARLGIIASVTREDVPSTYRVDYPIQGAPPGIACVSLGTPSRRLLDALDVYRARGGAVREVGLSGCASADEVGKAAASCEEPLLLVASGGLGLDVASLEAMVGYFERPEVRAVSPRVLFANGLVDYAGCIVQPDAGLCKLGHLLPASDGGYLGRAHRPYSAAALDGDCCLMRTDWAREALRGTGYATVAFALADAGLGSYARGMVNVYTPFATAQWEIPRSLQGSGVLAFPEDRRLLAQRRGGLIAKGDPSHSPNFDPYSPYYRLG